MNKITKHFISSLLIFICTIGSISTQAAEEKNICRDTGVAFIFFNGVNTTPSGANRAKEEFKRIHGEKSTNGDEIKYEILYLSLIHI